MGGADIIIDARGQFCPVPVIRTAEAIKRLPPGGTVLVMADDPAIEYDLPAWGKSAGHEVRLERREGRVFHHLVRMTDPPPRREGEIAALGRDRGGC